MDKFDSVFEDLSNNVSPSIIVAVRGKIEWVPPPSSLNVVKWDGTSED